MDIAVRFIFGFLIAIGWIVVPVMALGVLVASMFWLASVTDPGLALAVFIVLTIGIIGGVIRAMTP